MNTSEVLNRAADLIEERGWTDYGHLASCPASIALAEYLGVEKVWPWNDDFTRTQDEVIEALRACAVIEASREREVAEVTESVSA